MTTVSTSTINSSGNGYTVIADNEIVVINAGIIIGTDNATFNGFFSDSDGTDLTNNGTIISSSTFAVMFASGVSGGGSILNSGSIIGSDGLDSHNKNVGVTNSGFIAGLAATGVDFAASGCTLSNDAGGRIYGAHFGIRADQGDLDGGSISNAGRIWSDQDAIWISSNIGLVTTIDNLSGGVIQGPSSAIHTHAGILSLTNAGTIVGQIVCTAPNEADSIQNHGIISGAIHLGSGNDTFDGSGGTSGAVFGENGNDLLIGGSLIDALDGGVGTDKLHGGLGKDQLTGGAGPDQFFFDAPLSPANVDRITDFTHAVDKIELSHAIFTKVNAAGHALSAAMFHVGPAFTAATQRIDYNAANGWLTYDSNGSTAGGVQVHFATLAAHLTLTNGDLFVIA